MKFFDLVQFISSDFISPFFKSLEIMKCFDHVQFILSDSMYKFHKHLLTSDFSRSLTPVKSIYTYITRLAS